MRLLLCLRCGGIVFCLWRYGEGWQRWLEVLSFIPISIIYFIFQASLIVISWIHLTALKPEWVPTARAADDKEHTLKIEGESKRDHAQAGMPPSANTDFNQGSSSVQ